MRLFVQPRLGITVVTGVLFCALLSTTWANGFRNPPPGARGLAMDGGKIAFLDDATTVSENAANMTEAKENSFMAAFTFIYPDAEFTSDAGGTANVDDSLMVLPNLYGLWGMEEKNLVFGLGLTTPYGQSTEWDKSAPFRYSAPYFSQMEVLDLSPVVATRINDQLSIGAGLDMYYSELETRQLVPWAMALSAPGLPDGEAKMEGDGVGVGAHFGMTWKVHEQHRLAATYRSQYDVDYEGDFTLSGLPPAAEAGGVADSSSEFETTIKFPNWVTLGYGYTVNEFLRVGVDVEWVQFSRYDTLELNLGTNSGKGLAPESQPQNWKDIWTYGIAMEWLIDDNSRLWATYKYLESPIPDETFTPSIVDADKHAVGLGMGHQMGAHYLAYTYQINLLDDREISTQPDPTLNGTYEAMSHLFSLSYAYTF